MTFASLYAVVGGVGMIGQWGFFSAHPGPGQPGPGLFA